MLSDYKSVIYLIMCTSCKVQYVGSSVDFKPRFREHKSDIKLKKTAKCRTAKHWATHHKSSGFLKIMLIQKVCCEKENVEASLHEREIYWQHTLMTMTPHGMNKRDELYIGKSTFQNTDYPNYSWVFQIPVPPLHLLQSFSFPLHKLSLNLFLLLGLNR